MGSAEGAEQRGPYARQSKGTPKMTNPQPLSKGFVDVILP